MTDKNNGGPAFPAPHLQDVHLYALAAIDGITDPDKRDLAYEKARSLAAGGMTLLDYFAGQLAAGDWAAQSHSMGIWRNDVIDAHLEDRARLYFRMARAMIRVRGER